MLQSRFQGVYVKMTNGMWEHEWETLQEADRANREANRAKTGHHANNGNNGTQGGGPCKSEETSEVGTLQEDDLQSRDSDQVDKFIQKIAKKTLGISSDKSSPVSDRGNPAGRPANAAATPAPGRDVVTTDFEIARKLHMVNVRCQRLDHWLIGNRESGKLYT